MYDRRIDVVLRNQLRGLVESLILKYGCCIPVNFRWDEFVFHFFCFHNLDQAWQWVQRHIIPPQYPLKDFLRLQHRPDRLNRPIHIMLGGLPVAYRYPHAARVSPGGVLRHVFSCYSSNEMNSGDALITLDGINAKTPRRLISFVGLSI
jgi:hypothetical protein